MIFAPGTALLTDAFPPRERGRAIGLNAVAVALGVSTGPTLGGLLTGVGIAFFQSPNNRALMASAPRSEQGEASGLLATGRVVGQSLSVALAGAVFGAFGGADAANALVAAQSPGQTLAPDQFAMLQQTFVQAFHAALLTSAALAAIGIATSLVRGNEANQQAEAG